MKKLILIVCIISSLSLNAVRRRLQSCEPCKALTKSCDWDSGAQHWYQTPYNGSIGSLQSSFLSEVGYPNPDAARVII